MSVKITDLGNIPNPLDGTELLEIVQSVSGVLQSRNVTTAQLGLFAGGTITGTGIKAPTAGLPYDYDANLTFQNANALQTAQIGWNGASQFRVQLEAFGAEFAVRGFDSLGAARNGIDVDFDGSVRIYDNNAGPASELNAITGAASTGGLFVNNLLTGAGLERVLTTSDLGGPATIIIEDEGTPVGVPADTLDFVGAGVTVTGAGTTKTVTIPGGGGGGAIINGTIDDQAARWDVGNAQWEGAAQFAISDGVTGLENSTYLSKRVNGAKYEIVGDITTRLTDKRGFFGFEATTLRMFVKNTTNSSDVAISARDNIAGGTDRILGIFNPTQDTLIAGQVTGVRIQSRTTSPVRFIVGSSIDVVTVDEQGLNVIGNGTQSGIIDMTEGTGPFSSVAGVGQLYVLDDVPCTLLFRDDAGNDVPLSIPFTAADPGNVPASGGGTANFLRADGTWAAPTASVPDPLIISSINVTSALSPTSGGAPYVNCPINIGANLIGTMPMTVLARQRIQNHTSSFAFGGTLFINIDGGDVIIGGLNGANITVDYNNAVELQHGTSPTVVAQTATPAAGGFQVNNQATGGGLERVLTTSDIGGISPPIVLLDGEQIQFGTGTDVTMDWDGAQFEIEFAAAASVVRVHDGAQVRFLTPDDLNYTFIQQLADRTNILSTAGAGFWQFQPELRMIGDLTFGTGGTASLSVTGTDLNINVSALSDIRMRSGTDIHFEATANGSVALYYDNARRFETQAINTDGNVSGATIDDAGGVQVDVGFNVMQWRQENAVIGTTSNEWREHAGHNMFQDDGAARTWTLPASGDTVVPDGAIIDVTNLGAGNLTIAEGAGVTLTWLDGSTGSTGNRTLAQWGIATLTKRSGTQWYIFGSGIS